ncbi:MAG: biosynthetic arginine decarboxylase [Salinisphaeraceae bacterium]|nr:biosynthetic arginine decarboxylase [Salinisphaeraceae bacterium]
MKSDWQASDARQLYSIAHWGEGYFDVADNGHLLVRPRRSDGPAIDIPALAKELPANQLHLPVLLRFRQILHDRVDRLCNAFTKAITSLDYQGHYHCVYPIKVNQQRTVIEQIVAHGGKRVGLEAGSKPELMAVLGMAPTGGLIVCNGYKDREYIRLALIARQLGHRIYLVIEKPAELELILQESAAMKIAPLLGLRVRLATIGAGNWQNSGGEKAKFGLSASQVLALVERLRHAGQLDCLRMMHVHLGSQIANVRDIQRGLGELGRSWQELHRLGVPLDVLDVGGGLGVDYEGTRSRSYYSVNYSMDEYALNVVRSIAEACREQDLPEPDIITESGRALTAHHAILLSNVVDIESAPDTEPSEPAEGDAQILHDLWQTLQNPDQRPALECFHDAANWLSEAQAQYTHGDLSLTERAQAEQLYYAVCRKLLPLLNGQSRQQRELVDGLREALADKLFCNLSLFQSLPDVWGIGQIFPVLPIARLDEEPTRRATLCDLTCDSDGQIKRYVDGEGIESSLPVHALREGEPYILAFCMVGAYQEILGDMHNLFGDTDAVDVEVDEQGNWQLLDPEQGDRADELLRYVHMAPETLKASYDDKLSAIGDEDLREQYRRELYDGLSGYTYLED